MPLSTRIVTALILRPDGTPKTGARVTFTPTASAYTADATYPVSPVYGTVGADGQLVDLVDSTPGVQLVAGGSAGYLVAIPGDEVFEIAVPAGSGAVSLEALRAASGEPQEAASSLQTLIDAHDADSEAHADIRALIDDIQVGSGMTQGQADARYAQRTNNLSDLVNPTAARTNLGLGTAATQNSTAFAAVGDLASETAARAAADTALQASLTTHVARTDNPHGTTAAQIGALATANNLGDLGSAVTARSNLGLGSAATAASGDFAPAAHVGAGGSAHAAATTGAAGFMSAADKTKLDGVAPLATANVTDAQLRDRATHTGTQAASTISDLTETVQDLVGAMLTAGSNVTIGYDDATGLVTIGSTGGGGGGGSASSGPYASRPAAGTAGAIYYATNSPIVSIDSGSTWSEFAHGCLLTPPPTSGWSWVNQGGASVDTTLGGIRLSAVNTGGGGADFRLRVRSAPSTPYTITTLLTLSNNARENAQAGLCFRDSSTGKLHTVGLYVVADSLIIVSQLRNSETSYGGNYETPTGGFGQTPIWLRLADNGANRSVSYSLDGYNFIPLHSTGRTTDLTPDQVGFYGDAYVNSYGGVIYPWLLSWAVS